jgi:hypothetical protein
VRDPDDLVAELVASGAGSWDAVARGMTLHHYNALQRYWARHPPAHLLLAAWLGVGPKPEAAPADLGDLVAMFGMGAIR